MIIRETTVSIYTGRDNELRVMVRGYRPISVGDLELVETIIYHNQENFKKAVDDIRTYTQLDVEIEVLESLKPGTN